MGLRARWIAWAWRRFGTANKRRSPMASKKARVLEKRATKKKQTWSTNDRERSARTIVSPFVVRADPWRNG